MNEFSRVMDAENANYVLHGTSEKIKIILSNADKTTRMKKNHNRKFLITLQHHFVDTGKKNLSSNVSF